MNTNIKVSNLEFIFKLTDSSVPPVPSDGIDSTKNIPLDWTLEPQGVSQSLPYEWFRVRVNDTEPFGSPGLWNQFKGDVIKIGDVVRLKSGGPHMTVNYISKAEPNQTATCYWFKMTAYCSSIHMPMYDSEPMSEHFSIQLLKLVD